MTFDAGHRVCGHESKCAHIHGHTYRVEITAEAANLDGVGRVIDFSYLKEVIGGWIDANWDHGFIAWEHDPDLVLLRRLQTAPAPDVTRTRTKLYILPENPTSENMANHLLTRVCPALLAKTPVRVTKIVLWETPNCFSTASLARID
jgi:6-pyruvoyltetrahydropterin/6-carboxytetrahydropterin synthase